MHKLPHGIFSYYLYGHYFPILVINVPDSRQKAIKNGQRTLLFNNFTKKKKSLS